MSTPDSSLSPQERAAFADLEAAARAADPQLAARLGGARNRMRALVVPPRVMSYLVGRWRMALRHGWWGVPVVVVGFGLMAIGLGAGLAVAVIGAVLAAVGLRLVAHAAKLGWDARQRQSDR